MEQGPDFWCWFDTTQFSPNTCKDVFNPNVTTFQSNCAEGLHFSAFHCTCTATCYSLFTFSWLRFESGSLRNGGMLKLRIYFAVDGMPIEMYGENWIAGLLTSDNVML